MMFRVLLLFIAVLVGFSAQAEDKFDVDNHEAFLAGIIGTHFDRQFLLDTNGLIKEWVEIELDVSIDKKITGYQITQSSSNDAFNERILNHLLKFEKSIRLKKVNGEEVPSVLKYRNDACINTHNDNWDGNCIDGYLKLLKSDVIEEDIDSVKKVLVYFQYEVPEGIFKASLTMHQDGNFVAIKVETNSALLSNYQMVYPKKFRFNSLKNKELLSMNEFYEAYVAYTNWAKLITSDQGEIINPETFNEHKPLAEKTEYWFTRPKSAKPQFSQEKYLFGDYSAELDALDFQGLIKLTAHVEPTGLLNSIEIIEGSGIDRVDKITLKVLDRMYITPAYQDYRNVADDIEFEVSFQR